MVLRSDSLKLFVVATYTHTHTPHWVPHDVHSTLSDAGLYSHTSGRVRERDSLLT